MAPQHLVEGPPTTQFDEDLRAGAVEQRREKERRVRYRNVNMNLMGKPVNPLDFRRAQMWNQRNKFKMPNPHRASCYCASCRRWNDRSQRKSKKFVNRDGILPALHFESDDSLDAFDALSEGEDDAHSQGVIYSFDSQTGPRTEETLGYAVTEAFEKFQNRELASLIKNEYEVVNSSDSEEEFELI